jgi:hypothetical protein
MNEEQTIYRVYVLSAKGGYYDELGRIAQDIEEARFFRYKDHALAFRARYDPIHKIDESVLLSVQLLVSEV